MSSLHRIVCCVLSLSLALPATPMLHAAQKTKSPPGKAPAVKARAQDPAAAKAAPKIAAPAAKPLDLNFVQPDAFVVAVLQPRAFFEAPEMELFPREVVTAAIMKEVGIDPATVDRVVLSVAYFEPPREPSIAIAAWFAHPPDPKQGLAPIKARAKESTFAGKTYWVDPRNQLGFAMPDNRTLIVAPEPVLKQFLSAKVIDTPMIRRLKQTDFSAHSVAVISLDAIRSELNKIVAQAPPLPPQFQPFLKIPELVSSLEIRTQFGGNPDLEWIFHARDEQSAAQLERLIEQGIAVGKQMFVAQISQMLQRDDPVEQALAQYMRRLVDHFAGLVKPARQGERVIIAIDTQGGWGTTGVLVALLLPAVQAAREAARRTAATNNMRQILLSFMNYEAVHKTYPPRSILDKQGKPLLSWRVAILPYLEENELYREFRLDEPWDSEHNQKLIPRMPAVFSHPNLALRGKTTYFGPVGDDTVFASSEPTRIRDITDGTSNTIVLLEVNADRAIEWTRPDDYEVEAKQPLAGLGHLRAGNVFAAGFADGSVRMISTGVDPKVFLLMLKKSDGQVINLE